MTEFDAINRMLRYLGELPVPNDVAIDDLPEGHEAVMARIILNETVREEQEERWWFNSFTMTFIPNSDGYITMPRNIIEIVDTQYLINGNDLYDVDNQTKVFTNNVELKILQEIAFEDLPQVFQTYVILIAAKHLHVYLNGDELTQKELTLKLQRQMIKLDKANMKQHKYNLITGSRLIDRSSNPTPVS